jgi:hypothetical protein
VPGELSHSSATFEDVAKNQYVALTTGYYEPEVVLKLNRDNVFLLAKGGLHNLGKEDKRKAHIVDVPIDTQAFDRYAYSRNNSLKYIDPTGHSYIVIFTLDQLDYFLSLVNLEIITPLQNQAATNAAIWGVVGGGIGILGGLLCSPGALVCSSAFGFTGLVVGATAGYYLGGGWELNQINQFAGLLAAAGAYAKLHGYKEVSFDWFDQGNNMYVVVRVDGRYYGSLKMDKKAWSSVIDMFNRHRSDLPSKVK